MRLLRPPPPPPPTPADEKDFHGKLQQGLSPKEIVGPARKRPAASRTPRPTPKPKPFEWPTLALTPELGIVLSVVGLFLVPLLALVGYCLVNPPKQARPSAPREAAPVAPAAKDKKRR